MLKQDTFALENFEGPIDFLLYLIQKDEMDIYEVPIQDLIQQFINKLQEWNEKHLDRGAEFIGTAAYLVWLKSKMLLPKHEEENKEELEQEEDPRFEIIHHLIDYCRFKQLSKDLIVRQDQEQAIFYRGTPPVESKKPSGLDNLSLENLAVVFNSLIARAGITIQQIHPENFKVSDKIRLIRLRLKTDTSFALESLFSVEQCRMEWIVLFLALLELMKLGEACVGRRGGDDSSHLIVYNNQGIPS